MYSSELHVHSLPNATDRIDLYGLGYPFDGLLTEIIEVEAAVSGILHDLGRQNDHLFQLLGLLLHARSDVDRVAINTDRALHIPLLANDDLATGRLASIPNRLSPKAFTMACENMGVDMKATEIVKKRFAIGTMAVLAGAAVLEAALGRYRGRWDRIRGGLQGWGIQKTATPSP